MIEKSQGVSNIATETKKKTSPRASFPRLALSKVLLLAQQIYELGEGDPVPRLIVFDRLGKSPESGPSRMLISTSNAYGLTTGGYQAERLGITDRGRNIVQAENKQVARTYSVKVLLENDLFSQFYEKIKNKGVPQEPVAIDFLKQVGNLSESDAKTAYEVFLANMNDYGFIQEMSGRPTIVSQELMDLVTPKEADVVAVGQPKTTSEEHAVGRIDQIKHQQSANSELIQPQFNFNIQVQLPENASTETYDAIFKSISEHLLSHSK